MKIVKIGDVEKVNYSERPLFEGGEVYAQLNFFSDVAKDLMVGVMTFEPGCMTKMHTHDFEQVIYAISGKGKVADEKEESIIMPGTYVFFAPGERHAHGATKDEQFVQLTIMNPGKATQMHRM
jgi:quercetin dioxygenase-like cupin family protein